MSCGPQVLLAKADALYKEAEEADRAWVNISGSNSWFGAGHSGAAVKRAEADKIRTKVSLLVAARRHSNHSLGGGVEGRVHRDDLVRVPLPLMFDAYGGEGGGVSPEEMAAVRSVAGGRVWSGEQGVEVGLVDLIGGFQTAIDLVKKLAGIPPDTHVQLRPFPRNRGFALLSRLLDADTPDNSESCTSTSSTINNHDKGGILSRVRSRFGVRALLGWGQRWMCQGGRGKEGLHDTMENWGVGGLERGGLKLEDPCLVAVVRGSLLGCGVGGVHLLMKLAQIGNNHLNLRSRAGTHVCVHIHAHTHKYVHMHVRLHVQIRVHIHMHLHIRIHMHTHILVHIHEHTYTDTNANKNSENIGIYEPEQSG